MFKRCATVWAYENHHGNRLRATCSLDRCFVRLTNASTNAATRYATIIATRTDFQRIVFSRNVVRTAKISPPRIPPNRSIAVSVGAAPSSPRRNSFMTTNPPPTSTVSTVARIQSLVGTTMAEIVPLVQPARKRCRKKSIASIAFIHQLIEELDSCWYC